MQKLSGSKYLQSDLKNVLNEIKVLLDNGKYVLFSGTPCQVAGLYACLDKNYENLTTIDLLCYGTPSPLAFKKYLNEFISADEKIEEINFRDKTVLLRDEINFKIKTNQNEYWLNSNNDLYYKAFINNLMNRESCGDCKYSGLSGVADITLGDFEGIEKFDENLNDFKGISFGLTNNEKGQALLNAVKNEFKIFQKVPIGYVKTGNSIFTSSFKAHSKRQKFFDNLNKFPFSKNVENCLFEKYDVGIIGMWFIVTGKQIGRAHV